MQNAQRLDVLLPHIVEKLDVVSLAHRLLQSFDEGLCAVVARYSLPVSSAVPRGHSGRFLLRRSKHRATFARLPALGRKGQDRKDCQRWQAPAWWRRSRHL